MGRKVRHIKVEYRIRALEASDLRDVNEIRTMLGVMETIPT